MRAFQKALKLIGAVELIVATALLILLTVAILSQVVLRYGWDHPLRWVEEFGTGSLIWITFLAGSLVYKEEGHMRLWTPAAGRGVTAGGLTAALIQVVVLVVSALVVLVAWKVVGVENRSLTTSLPIDLPRGYVFSVPVMVGFSSIALSALFFLIEDLAALAGRDGRRSISPFGRHGGGLVE